jgi:hypothetical protein
MLDLGTIAGLHQYRHTVGVYCPACRRWAELNLAAMVRDGRGDTPVTVLRPQCRRCGGAGEKQVRPPAPVFAGFENYGPALR